MFFSATGISDGDLLKGVRYWGNGASTQSMVMRSKSGTIRTIDATHQWQKLMKYSALKCLGGEMFGRLYPRNDEERQAALDAGYDLDQVLTTDALVSGEDVFFSATGISDGDLLRGVRYWGKGASTQSMVMRSKSGTIRTVDATHRWQKLMRYSAVKFD